jgi:ABC-type multidrug transport system ATPase subunit
MSSHTLEIAEDMCDRIGIMQRGELVACGTCRARGASGHDGRSKTSSCGSRATWWHANGRVLDA